MWDSEPAERQADAGAPAVESTAEWSEFLDRLINWAVGQGDAAADQIHSYLRQRTDAGSQPQSAGPGAESVNYRRRSGTYRGRDRAGSPLRHRLPGCTSRP